MQIFADALYWRATESVNWILTSNFSLPNQDVTYHTLDFNNRPGFRIGIASSGEWQNKLYFTKYDTRAIDYTSGNLVGVFLAAKIANPSGNYNNGSAEQTIHYNTLDWDVSKTFHVSENVTLRPLVGLKAGVINQSITTDLDGSTTAVIEKLKNDFTGIGPKAGLGGDLTVYKLKDAKLNLFADFSLAYLVGHWVLKDKLTHKDPFLFDDIDIDIDSRNFGSLTFHTLIGAKLSYESLLISLGYEITDWFNQGQYFDDGTGPQTDDLVLQGLTFNITYKA